MKPDVRKKAEENIIKWMKRVDPSGLNAKLYAEALKRLNDAELEELCTGQVPIYSPPNGKVKLNAKNLYEIGEELGHVWRQRIWLYDQDTGIRSLSKCKHLVTYTVIRRQTQHVEDKQSMAEHTNAIDTLTGQVSGKSKTSTFSYPQIFEHFSKGAHYSLVELLNHRGGNLEAGRALNRQIRATGSGSLNFEGSQRTRTGSSMTLGKMLTAMHLGNTLLDTTEGPRQSQLGTESIVSGYISKKGTVSERNGTITIHGIAARAIKRFIDLYWNTTRVTRNMLQDHGPFSRSLFFKSFFAVEMLYILDELKNSNDLPHGYIKLIDKVIEGIQENTWIKNTIDPVQLKLNYKRLDSLNVKLMDAQLGFLERWSWHRPKTMMNGILLHADPGTGKTISGYGWSLVNEFDTTIFVVPMNSVISVWEDTILKYFKDTPSYWHSLMSTKPTGKEQYIIVHYHYLDKLIYMMGTLKAKRIGVWLDESHNLNESISKRSGLFNSICHDPRVSGVVWASGTPLKAISKETIPLFKSIDPMFTSDVEESFKKIFGISTSLATDILRNRIGLTTHRIVKESVVSLAVNEEIVKVEVPNSKRFSLDEISAAMQSFVKERIKFYRKQMPKIAKEYLDLCDRYEARFMLNNDAEWNRYRAHVQKMHEDFRQREDLDLIKYCSKYERDVMRPRLSNVDKKVLDSTASAYKYVVLVVRGEALGRILTRSRIDCFKAMIPHSNLEVLIEAARKKTIIFTSYIEVVDAIYDYLKETGYEPLRVYGETTGELEDILKKFKTDKKANPIIATFSSLSTAVPIIEASTAIMFNSPFRQYIYDQAASRVNRLGQDGPVDIYSIVLDTGEVANISTRSLVLQEWSRRMVDMLLNVDMEGIDAQLY